MNRNKNYYGLDFTPRCGGVSQPYVMANGEEEEGTDSSYKYDIGALGSEKVRPYIIGGLVTFGALAVLGFVNFKRK
jgi:hypothetical protein